MSVGPIGRNVNTGTFARLLHRQLCTEAVDGPFGPATRVGQRLEAVRETFYPIAGKALGGRTKPVQTQATEPGFSDYWLLPFLMSPRWTASRAFESALMLATSAGD
jgi:hypothetical protein